MKKSSSGLILAAIALTFSGLSFGQGSPASSLQRSAVPYSFDAPSGWKRTEGAMGSMMVNPAESIIILVKPHSEGNAADAVRTTEIDSSYRVVGDAQTLKNGAKTFRVTKQTKNGGTGVVDVFVLMAPNGQGGVLVMALSGPANAAAAFEIGLNVSNSVTFGRSQQSAAPPLPRAAATASSGGSERESRISGKHLLFMYSGNGYFEEKHIYLCSSGTFVQTKGSGGYTPGNSDGGSFAARGGRRGRWSVSGSTLVLQFQDGAAVQYNITQRQARNEVGLNGKRFFIDGNAGC